VNYLPGFEKVEEHMSEEMEQEFADDNIPFDNAN
jgi:hypothetical protein